MINAGNYNKKIIIYKNEKVKDSDGFSIDQEVEVLKTYAKVKTTKGFTLIANNSDFEKAFTNFTIRYPKTEITRDMLLKYNNKIYTIEYLNNIDEANIELEMQCKLVVK
jgi:SPP1 family predicted phage head-tail adaptor